MTQLSGNTNIGHTRYGFKQGVIKIHLLTKKYDLTAHKNQIHWFIETSNNTGKKLTFSNLCFQIEIEHSINHTKSFGKFKIIWKSRIGRKRFLMVEQYSCVSIIPIKANKSKIEAAK